MNKRLLFAIVPVVALLAALLLFQHHPAPQTVREPVIQTKTGLPALNAPVETSVASSQAAAPETDSMEARILDLSRRHGSPAEMAALLKELYGQDPRGLFDTLMNLRKASLETRQTLAPLLAKALMLWPEAEGRYVVAVVFAYGDTDLPGAAAWAASFLAATHRTDLSASMLVGRLAGTSEEQAIALLGALPQDARKGALIAAASNISTDDLNHLLEVSKNLDPNDSTVFSKELFRRLGMVRLDDTAAWLASTPEAERLPGAVAAIAQGLVISGDRQQAISWADSLPDETARGQAIAAVYKQWARNDPESAIQDILSAYGGAAPQLMGDVFKGAAERGPDTYWATACNLENPSARAYALSALIEPMLLTSGLAETQSRIAALPPDSLERNVADIVIQAAVQKPMVALHLQNSQGR